MERFSRDTISLTTAELNELKANRALDPTVEYWVDKSRIVNASGPDTLVEGAGNSVLGPVSKKYLSFLPLDRPVGSGLPRDVSGNKVTAYPMTGYTEAEWAANPGYTTTLAAANKGLVFNQYELDLSSLDGRNLGFGIGVKKAAPTVNEPVLGCGTGMAYFTGTVAGNVLTASNVTGNIAVGAALSVNGVNNGVIITSFGTGTGGAGTYNLSNTQAGAAVPCSTNGAGSGWNLSATPAGKAYVTFTGSQGIRYAAASAQVAFDGLDHDLFLFFNNYMNQFELYVDGNIGISLPYRTTVHQTVQQTAFLSLGGLGGTDQITYANQFRGMHALAFDDLTPSIPQLAQKIHASPLTPLTGSDI